MSTKLFIPCDKCDGCGKLDSKEGKPWTAITRPNPNPEVRAGTIQPVECPKCKGAKRVESDKRGPEAPVVLAPVADGRGSATGGLQNVVTQEPKK